jgi:purine-binding chemotaxis protein CheW
VDSAREFISIPKEAIQPPPQGLSGLSGNYLEGVATVSGRVILIVDLEELWQVEVATATPQK